MFKAKLLKGLMIGLCVSALYTGTAFAASGGGSTPSFGGQTEVEVNALFDKQLEIDRYLFADHVKEMEQQKFSVVYTGVADGYVEIGITPYSDDYAKILYDLFGTEDVKVVESEEATLYTTMAATSDVASNTASDTDGIYTTMELAPDTPVSNTDVVEPAAGEDQELKIQITSVDGQEIGTGAEEIYQTVSADAADDAAKAEVVSARDNVVLADKNVDKDTKGLSAPFIILIIAGGAVVVGGAALLANKKRSFK